MVRIWHLRSAFVGSRLELSIFEISIYASLDVNMLYFLLKALHIISDFVWVGGMLVNAFVIAMVPAPIRVAAITALRPYDSKITMVAQVGAWLFGATLAIQYGWYTSGWFGFKLLLVILLSALYGMQRTALRRMEADPLLDPPAFVRAGIPIILVSLVVIILLAVIKPF